MLVNSSRLHLVVSGRSRFPPTRTVGGPGRPTYDSSTVSFSPSRTALLSDIIRHPDTSLRTRNKTLNSRVAWHWLIVTGGAETTPRISFSGRRTRIRSPTSTLGTTTVKVQIAFPLQVSHSSDPCQTRISDHHSVAFSESRDFILASFCHPFMCPGFARGVDKGTVSLSCQGEGTGIINRFLSKEHALPNSLSCLDSDKWHHPIASRFLEMGEMARSRKRIPLFCGSITGRRTVGKRNRA